jgi:hypothetical protein
VNPEYEIPMPRPLKVELQSRETPCTQILFFCTETKSSIQRKSSDHGERYPHHTTACFAFSSSAYPHVNSCSQTSTACLRRSLRDSNLNLLGRKFQATQWERKLFICPYRIDLHCQSSLLKPTRSYKLSQSLPFEG